VHVPVDDRNSLDPELRLRPARRHRDAVEDAKAHRAPGKRVVPRRPCERKAAPASRLERGTGGEQRSLEGRLAGNRVRVEPGRLGDRPHELDVVRRVAALDVLDRSRRGDLPLADRLQQDFDPPPRLRMVPGRVNPRQVGVRQDVDAGSALAANRAAIWPMPQPSRRFDASAHFGD
jgi:hypothetical protein